VVVVVLEGVMDWFVLLTPLAVVPLVALLVFAGCALPHHVHYTEVDLQFQNDRGTTIGHVVWDVFVDGDPTSSPSTFTLNSDGRNLPWPSNNGFDPAMVGTPSVPIGPTAVGLWQVPIMHAPYGTGATHEWRVRCRVDEYDITMGGYRHIVSEGDNLATVYVSTERVRIPFALTSDDHLVLVLPG
jgi:hypothetical protein